MRYATEEYRPCLTAEGRIYKDYYVSQSGTVISTKKDIVTFRKTYDTRGYDRVGFYIPGRKYKKAEFIHQLVIRSWCGLAPDPSYTVNHIDGNKKNNHFSNLEWLSMKDNVRHGIEIGLIDHKGEANCGAKLTDEQVLDIRSLYGSGYSYRELGKMYNVYFSTIGNIIRGQSWTHI